MTPRTPNERGLLVFQGEEWLAGEVLRLRARLEHAIGYAGMRYKSCRSCGHMFGVHVAGGCHGLKLNGCDEYGEAWGGCGCGGFSSSEGNK